MTRASLGISVWARTSSTVVTGVIFRRASAFLGSSRLCTNAATWSGTSAFMASSLRGYSRNLAPAASTADVGCGSRCSLTAPPL